MQTWAPSWNYRDQLGLLSQVLVVVIVAIMVDVVVKYHGLLNHADEYHPSHLPSP